MVQNRPSLAASIVAIDWIEDGIGASESEAVQEVVTLAAFHEVLTSSLIDRPWFADGVTETELEGIKYLGYIAYDSDATARQVADMLWFVDSITEMEVEAIDNLAYIAQSSEAVAELTVDMSWFMDGITETELEGVKYLGYITYDSESAARQVADMPWFVDGITQMEVAAVDNLAYIAQSSGAVAKLTVDMPWFVDGITEMEVEGIKYLSYIANDSEAAATQVADMLWFADGITKTEVEAVRYLGYIANDNAGAAERIAKMPFLTAIQPADVSALDALSGLAGFREDAFEQVMAHPSLADGITDAHTPIVAMLYGVAETNPALIDTLLDPESVNLEHRIVTLPLTGDVDLAIVRTGHGPTRSMDLLEYAVSSSEEIMGQPFPTRYVGLLYEDAASGGFAGTNFGTHIAVLPKYDVDDGSHEAEFAPHVIAHEVAHYYWSGNSDWVDEGVSDFMASTIEIRRTKKPVGVTNGPCIYARTIAELEVLAPDPDTDDEFGCNYSLGERLFVDMYRAIGEDAIWQGLRELYIDSLVDDGDLMGTPVNIGHLREAFQPYPGASTAIARWYEGTESYDLSQLDNDPSDPSLPSINGRIDETYVATSTDGPAVSHFSVQDVTDWVYLTLKYSYDVSSDPREVSLEIVEYYEDGFELRRGRGELAAEARSIGGTAWFSVGASPTQKWMPGRYWVYVYAGERKVAEVEYEVTP